MDQVLILFIFIKAIYLLLSFYSLKKKKKIKKKIGTGILLAITIIYGYFEILKKDKDRKNQQIEYFDVWFTKYQN